jgi:maltose O-acetyltransferase
MRIKARVAIQEYNQSVCDRGKRTDLLKSMLGKMGNNIDIQTPFFCDYGCHIEGGIISSRILIAYSWIAIL